MPQDFWKLTIKEFTELVDGYKWRDESDWQKIAQLAAWVVNPHVKKRITANKLLGKDKKKKKTTPEESKAVVVDLMARMGVEGGAICGNDSGNVG